MNFNRIPGENCGQISSVVQLIQHATQDLTFQENASIPSNSGLQQIHSMPPQSFQLDVLMGELQIAPPSPVANFQSRTTLAQNPSWEGEMQTELQSENFQGRVEMQAEMYEEIPFDGGNFQNFPSPDFQRHVQQNFITFYPQPEYEFRDQLQSEESDESEESYEKPLIHEAKSEQNTKEICRPLEPIVKFDDPQMFLKYLKEQLRKNRRRQWEINNPLEKYIDVSQEILLDDTKRYSHIVNNPYRNHSNPHAEGCAELFKEDWMKAVCCFDEAVRQDNGDTGSWIILSYALFMRDEPVDSLVAIKELLRIDPGCLWGYMTASHIYKMFDCHYQACQSIFNWLKFNAKYNSLIPEDFEMNSPSKTTKLERHHSEAVLHLFCKAVQQNPTSEDIDLLQYAMSEVLDLSGDFKKKADCVRTVLQADLLSPGKMIDFGTALFQSGNPYEALDIHMSAFHCLKCLDKNPHAKMSINYACTNLGLVNMYLQNYRAANNWFMRAITRNYNAEVDKMHSLEAEYDLCLSLYLKVAEIIKFL